MYHLKRVVTLAVAVSLRPVFQRSSAILFSIWDSRLRPLLCASQLLEYRLKGPAEDASLLPQKKNPKETL